MNGKSLHPDNVRAARRAGLVYVSDESRGIHRQRNGHGFAYVNARGKRVKDETTLLRINHLAIPPAYKDVWISPNPRGHIQAVGRDDRGRKQYRYHEKWREVRDGTKYARMLDFAKVLPKVRRVVARDLRRKGLPRRKVLAAVVRFMEVTLMRVGNDEYAKNNQSFGLTTLRDRHAKIRGKKVHFEFRGKSGIEHEFDVEDPRLAEIARKCQDLPGQELFQYLGEDGKVCDVGSTDVNDYLREISGEDFTTKDFRTWNGTVLAAVALAEIARGKDHAPTKKNVVRAVEVVAGKLGNTKAVCRKCYIHPEILAAYLDGLTIAYGSRSSTKPAKSAAKLHADELAVVALLKSRASKSSRLSAVTK
jgi:DNA topoisomerase-1